MQNTVFDLLNVCFLNALKRTLSKKNKNMEMLNISCGLPAASREPQGPYFGGTVQ
jgi:hypothetical protein